jgi:NTP pyrophosphatase (non-canonical NTP hydrolase)
MKTEEIMNLREAQKAIYQNKVDKGFNTSDVNKEFCLLYGEVAEAYDAWRKKKENVGEELADVAIYLLGLSEILGVDLAEEIEKKMRINQNRQYQDVNGVLLKKTEI